MGVFRKWYWRVVVAVIAGWVGINLIRVAQSSAYANKLVLRGPPQINNQWFAHWINALADTVGYHGMSLIYSVAPALAAVGSYHFLTKRYARFSDSESRCRQCGYILRGISEPRCSECGEFI